MGRHTIGLFIANPIDRQLLSDFLQQLGHEVYASPLAAREPEFCRHSSLIVADEAAARLYGKALLELKWRAGVDFLPLIIILPQKAQSAAWLHAGFDDVLRQPLTKEELKARLEVFLRFRKNAEQYQLIFENALVGIYRSAPDGSLLMANPALARMLGFSSFDELAEEIIKNPALKTEPSRAVLAKRLAREDEITGLESAWTRRDGATLFALESARAVRDQTGRMLYFEGSVENITERKRIEREREELLARERQARREAEEALSVARSIEEKLGALVEASGVLLGSPTLEAVQPAILDLSQRLISADAYAVWRGDSQSKVWRIVSSAGLSEKYREYQIEGWEPGNFVFDKPIVAEDMAQVALLETRREQYISEGICSLLVAPMRIHDNSFGTLTYYYRQPHRFSEVELRVATALANLAGAAIRSVELSDEQRQLRAKAQAAGWRANFLAEASSVLSSTLDYEATLARVARLAVPDLADWCAVDIREDGNSVKRVAVAHVDSAKVEWAHEIQKRYPPDMDAPRGVPQVLRTGMSEIYPEITDEMLTAAARDEEHLRLLRGVGFSSVMLVPLVAHGRTHGVITFITAESGRRYGEQDLALAEDLARRAAVAVENARLYEEAQQSNRLKDEFLATVSHELRTPLTAILGWVRMLSAGQLDAANTARALETIRRNAQSQAHLIDDLLDISRIITGKLRLEMRAVDLGLIITAAADAVRPAAQAKEIRLQMLLDPEAGTVLGDFDRLQQVVWNLLSNAVKFTPKGGRVEVRLERADSHLEIIVADNGQGIEPEFLPYVFDRFRQADQTTTRAHGGLGLGLSIVRQLVEMHGGTVHVESAGEGHGATFTVRLPSLAARVERRERAPQFYAERGSETMLDHPPRLGGLRVLVVDDEADTRELLGCLLVSHGAEVMAAASATEALEQMERKPPDLLISDIGMPDMDGYALIGKVRALAAERGANIPAVALTAYARVEDRVRALGCGFQMHVPKPVEPAELIAVIASLTGR